MPYAFLLRFQESCLSDRPPPVQVGVKTMTRVRAEQPDADPRNFIHGALPASVPQSGTRTKTAVATEQTDPDDAQWSGNIFPRTKEELTMATKSVTAVRAEAEDDDPRRHQLQVIPRCS